MPSRSLRVLYDNSLALNPAGTGTVVRGMLAALQQVEGVEVVVTRLPTRSAGTVDLSRKAPARRMLNAFEHLRYFAVSLPAQARQAGCDVIYSPSSLGPLRGQVPSVITIHDLAPVRYPATLHWVSRGYLQAMLRTQLRRSAAVCTGSRAVRSEILNRYPRLRPDAIHIVPDAPDPELLAATEVPVPDVDRPFFLMVGTIEPRKNHLTAIRAFAAYLRSNPQAQEQLVIAGSPGWLYQPVLDAIRTLNVSSRVVRLGRVDAGRLRWLYRHARALLFPSLYEGFGIPVLEAFALDCPVMAAHEASVEEVAGDGTIVLLDPIDVDAWAHEMQLAASLPPDPQRLERARRRAGLFSWPSSAAALCEALSAVVGAGSPSRVESVAESSGPPPG